MSLIRVVDSSPELIVYFVPSNFVLLTTLLSQYCLKILTLTGLLCEESLFTLLLIGWFNKQFMTKLRLFIN